MDNARTWYENLRRERELRGWTQLQVAKALHLDPKKVSEWERGKRKPSPKYRAKLFKLYGKNAEDFGFIDQEFSKEASDDDPQENDPQEEQIEEAHRAQDSTHNRENDDQNTFHETQIRGPHGIITIRQQTPNHIGTLPPASPSIHFVFSDSSLSTNALDPLSRSRETPVLLSKQGQNSIYYLQGEIPKSAEKVQDLESVASAVDLLEISTLVLSFVQELYQCSIDELLAYIRQALRGVELQKQNQGEDNFSRRQALTFLVRLPAALFGLTKMRPLTHFFAEEVLPLYAASIPACWRLYFAGELTEIKHVLPEYLSQLSALAQQSSKYQKLAASLASQAYQLDWLIALQRQDFGNALSSIKRAFQYGDIADDSNLRLSALVRQAHIFFHLNRPMQQVLLHQKAMQYSEDVSPLLQGWLYIVSAESYADPQIGNEREALRLLGLAQDTFPDHPENDPNFSYVPINQYTLANHSVLTYLHLRQPREAWKILTEIEKEVPTAIVPRRVELLSRKTATLLALGDMHETCNSFELTIVSAKTLGSALRYNEACETYEQMQLKWHHEQKVKDLADLLQP